MENELSHFMRQAPTEVIEFICSFVDFSDFLALTSTSRSIRSVLVSYHRCWLNFYTKGHTFRHYDASPGLARESEDSYTNSLDAPKYALRLPCFDKQAVASDPAAILLNSARKVDIIKMNNAHSSNPLLDLGILNKFKREKWKGESRQDVKVLSSFPSSVLVAPPDGNKPFSVISNSHICSFKEDSFRVNSFLPALKHVRTVCWMRLQDGKVDTKAAFGRGLHTSFSRRNDASAQKVLAITHENGTNGVAVSFYHYEENGISSDTCGLASSPGFTIDVDVEVGDNITNMYVSGVLSTWSGKKLQFTHLSVILGSQRGNVYQRTFERGKGKASKKHKICQFPISAIEVLRGSLAIVYSKENYIGVIEMGGDEWVTLENVHDSITSYSVDMDNCIVGYCTKIHNRSMFLDIFPYFSKALGTNMNLPSAISYSVPKPPLRIISLNRDSKWALVIRNYIRILQVLLKDNIIFKSLLTLNGHAQPITQCVHDGWSKLVSVDSSHQIFVWDYIDGCKLFSFSLISSTRERHLDPLDVYVKAMSGEAKKSADRNNRCRGNKMGNLTRYMSRCKIGCDEFDCSSFETESDYTPTHSTIDSLSSQSARYTNRSSRKGYYDGSYGRKKEKHKDVQHSMRGLLEPSKREDYCISVSVQSLLIYYQGSRTMQVWSFK